MLRSALLCLLLACATTPEYRLRVEGSSLYRNCLDIYGRTQKRMCAAETARWCLDQGLEKTCFVDYTRR